MATVNYSLDIDRDIERSVHVYMEGVTRDQLLDLSKRVKSEIITLIEQRAIAGGVELAHSVEGRIFDDGPNDFSATISSDHVAALWFEEGTGIHGPRSQRILVRSKKYMKFKPYFHPKIVYTKSVTGQKARHPFRDGLNKVVGQGGALRKLT